MELSDLAGLPAHPLLVHLPVVLVPLTGIFALVLVFVPRWRSRFLPVLVVGSVLAYLGAMLAAGSGEALEERVQETEALENHTELGDVAPWLTLLFLAVVVGWWAWERWGRSRMAPDHVAAKVAGVGLPVLVVLTAVLSTGWMVQTGHSGAESVWEDVKVGEEDGDRDEGEQGEEGEEEDGLAPLSADRAASPAAG